MYIILYFVGLIWLFIIFFDTIFKTCMLYPYYKTLRTAGVDIKPFVICWKTTYFNRFINRMGLYKPSFQRTWFNIGAIVTSGIVLPSLFLYTAKLVDMFQTVTPEEFESSKLVPVIPGYNFPLSHWKLYACVFFVCSIFHELGHALAASRLGVNLDSWGFALICIVPVAYVNLRFENISYCSKWEKMSIFCAGVWHNIILALWSLLLLKYFFLLISPLFYVGGGIMVLQIHEQSGLNDPGGLVTGDHIFQVGKCEVKDFGTWNKCLDKFEEKSQGLCAPRHLLLENSSSVTMDECVIKSDSLYFHTEAKPYKAGVCLQLRKAIQNYHLCTQSSECDESSICVFPYLSESHRFLVIFKDGKTDMNKHLDGAMEHVWNRYGTFSRIVLYAGSINELRTDVLVSEFLPRFTYISPSIAETTKEFLQYLLIFSSGLACLNVLPVIALDGKFITETLIHICFQNCFTIQQRIWFEKCISAFTVVVAGSLLVITLYKMLIFYL